MQFMVDRAPGYLMLARAGESAAGVLDRDRHHLDPAAGPVVGPGGPTFGTHNSRLLSAERGSSGCPWPTESRSARSSGGRGACDQARQQEEKAQKSESSQ